MCLEVVFCQDLFSDRKISLSHGGGWAIDLRAVIKTAWIY